MLNIMSVKFRIAEETEVKRMTAEKLNAIIEESGMKQKYIAEKVGISDQALSAMLNGRQRIDVDTFFAIAVVLNMTPDQIYAFRKGA